MSDSVETRPAALNRQELLGAIDYEIAHRETLLTRHGISTWGVAAAVAALLCAVVTEASGTTQSGTSYHWNKVILVLLVGRWCLGLLARPWSKALGWGLPFQPSREAYTIKEQILLHGVEPDTIKVQMIDTVLMLALASII